MVDFNSLKLERRTKKSVKDNERPNKDIAVIGVALQFPDANTPEKFWNNLFQAKSSIKDVPENRKRDIDYIQKNIYRKNEDVYYEKAAYLDEIDTFDNAFFSLSPKEAGLMDPNQRLFTQVAYKAMEDAGYGGERLLHSNTGVFVGFNSDSEYQKVVELADPDSKVLSVAGNIKPVVASRLAYTFDLKGPNMIVDTTCSSSLVAVHLAVGSLRNEECSMAIAGGIQIYVAPVERAHIGVDARDKKVKTFDNKADGTATGEGVGVVVLKPLAKAVHDRDNIYAVIKGSAVNHDGKAAGITAPNALAQEQVIMKAWKNAGVKPETISYIEAHGTGTKLGDPIEIDGISRAFANYTTQKGFCGIGSVKTNIGHLDAASGIAGLIKSVMALKEKKIPQTLNFEVPNENIDFIKSPLYIVDTPREWESAGFPRRCGVSSFGLSGTNCHIVLEEAVPVKRSPANQGDSHHILLISGKTREALNSNIEQLTRHLQENRDVRPVDLSYTANTGRGHYGYRAACIYSSIDQLVSNLEQLQNVPVQEADGFYYGYHTVVNTRQNANPEKGIFPLEEIDGLSREADKVLDSYIGGMHTLEASKQYEYLEKLANLYVKGALIKWEDVYRNQPGCKISLPTYAFAPKRCWFLDDYQEARTRGIPMYKFQWKEKVLPEQMEQDLPKNVLLVMDGKGYGHKMAAQLEKMNISFVKVTIGTAFSEVSRMEYTVGTDRASWDALWNALDDTADFDTIVHLAALNDDKEILEDITGFDEYQKRGMYSLFHLTRSLLAHRSTAKSKLILLARTIYKVLPSDSQLNPGAAAYLGLGKVIPEEYPIFQCRAFDIDGKTDMAALVKDFSSNEPDYLTAYRDNKRYVQELHELEEIKQANKSWELQKEGVYVITGGTGDLGLEVAGALAKKEKVKIALVNRNGLPPCNTWDELVNGKGNEKIKEKINRIREIESSGCTVQSYSADISNEAEVEGLCKNITSDLGPIRGLFHCAGIPGDGFLVKKNLAEFESVLKPKVQGTLLLRKYTKNSPLDFFVLFSSINTLMGIPGQSAYTSANCFLDAFAEYNRAHLKTTIAIDWAGWKNLGMTKLHPMNDRGIFKLLDARQGIEALEAVIAANITGAVVGDLNPGGAVGGKSLQHIRFALEPKLQDLLSKGAPQDLEKPVRAKKKSSRVILSGKEDNDYTEIEIKIAQIWKEVLGVEEVATFDNFFDIGGDSIMINRMFELFQGEFPGQVSLADLFNYTTINDLAVYIEENNDEKNETDSSIEDLVMAASEGTLSLDDALEKFKAIER